MASEETIKTAEKAEKPKKIDEGKGARRSNRKLIGIIIAAVALVVAAVVAIIVIINLNHGDSDKTVFDTDAFFLPESDKTDTKYALFRNNGERLTEFEYTGVGEFVNGYAAVMNSDGKYGVIDHNGKITVDFTDGVIYPLVGFYELTVTEGDTESKKLILGDGREIAKDYDNLTSDHSSPFVIVTAGDKATLYNVYGENIFECASDAEPQLNSYTSTTVSSVRTKEGITLLNNQSLKAMTTFVTDKKYEIESANKERTIVVLRDKDAKSGNYAVYNNGNITEYGDQCKGVSIQTDSSIDRTYLSCKTDDKSKLIRNGEVSDIVTESHDNEYRVYDEKHFAKYDSKEKRADFYVDGEKKASVGASYAPTVSIKGYYIRDNDKKTVSLYSIDGDHVYTLSETNYGDLAGLDENENIIVRDPNQDENKKYYLVNAKGETISEKYYYLANHGAYYAAKNSDKETMSLLDKDGKVIVSGKYREFNFYNDDKIVFARNKDDDYIYIDLDNKTEKFTAKGNIYYNHVGYIKAVEDKKVVYYTEKGEKIHEYNR